MPTPLELYRAWENSETKEPMLVLKVDRGDLAAAKRLTITSKPYIDPGVSGSHYHDTYPAPIAAFPSHESPHYTPRITDEGIDFTEPGHLTQAGRTAYSDIVLLNEDGQFDNIITEYNIIGNNYEIEFGDVSWSLVETDYPYRFQVVERGYIRGIQLEEMGAVVRIQVAPIRYGLDKHTSLQDEPTGLGRLFNCQAFLIDSGTHRYRANFYVMGSTSANIAARDNGNTLTYTTDYSPVTSGGFFGSIDKSETAVGRVTMDMNNNYGSELFGAIRSAVINATSTGYVLEESLDLSAEGNICRVISGSYFYVCDGAGAATLERWTMPTADTLSTSVGDGDTYDLKDDLTDPGDFINDIDVTSDQGAVYACGEDNGAAAIMIWTFGIPGVPSTLSYRGAHDISGLTVSAAEAVSIRVSEDETKIWVLLDIDDVLHELDQATPRTPGSISVPSPAINKDFSKYDRQPIGFDIKDGGKRLYLTGSEEAQIMQFDLPTANTIAEVVYTHRSYGHRDTAVVIDPVSLHIFENKMYVFNGSDFLNRHIDEPSSWNLSYGTFEHNVYSGYGYYDGGVWFGAPVPWGQIIHELMRSLDMGYSITRRGQIRGTIMRDPTSPETFEEVIEIERGDFFGEREWIRSVGEAILPVENVTSKYRRNFSPQSEDELASGLTEDQKNTYSRTHLEYTLTNSLGANVESRDMVIDGYFYSVGNVHNVTLMYKNLYSQARFIFELDLWLRCTPLHSEFDVGSIIRAQGDLGHPQIADGDEMLVIGRRINWSEGKQTLTVFL